ncbi:hypothetical protein JCM14076_15670 [Methylosoma difficile]
MRRIILLCLLACPAFADEAPPKLEQVPDVPQPPLPVHSGENLEPDITIVRRGNQIVHEYRRSGRLYMVKVVPDIGPAYYFLDTNGDGKLDIRRSDMNQDGNVNLWKIFEWD